jgi:hypothetical protein
MAWTNWRLLADRSSWYSDLFDHVGPACYELSIAGPRGGNRTITYCGHTVNEKARLSNYGRDGSHLATIIVRHLRQGWFLYYRARACTTKDKAEAMERRMLDKYDYPWNILLNN